MDDTPLSLKGKIRNGHLRCRQDSIVDAATRHCKASLSILRSKMVRELVKKKKNLKS